MTQLKIMVVDDTIVYRKILSDIVATIAGADLIATAINGKIALQKLEETPADIVLLDIEMPEMDGMETLQVIRQKYPLMGVIMVSGMNRSSADITMRCLEKGAMDFIPKPDGSSIEQNVQDLKQRLEPLFKNYASRRSIVLTGSTPQPVHTPPPPPVYAAPQAPSYQPKSTLSKVDVIAIGVSTGGPNALNDVIPKLPANIGVPILIVQHMPPVFTASLASHLDAKSNLRVKEAEAGEPVVANTVYIAPGGKHMLVSPHKTIILNEDPPENSCRPAVDVLFRSVVSSYRQNILSVIMTGMGSDGAKGVKFIKEATNQSYCLSQTENTCVVYGMPRAVDEQNLSDEKVDLPNLAHRIMSLVQGQAIGLSH